MVDTTEARTHVGSPLHTMTQTTPTALWNDSADPAELRTAIAWGAVGATCNPVIALAAIRADQRRWEARIAEIAAERPTAGESEIGWRVVEEVSLEAARLLEPAFAEHRGRNGRLSMQTDPRLRRSATGAGRPGRVLRLARPEHHRQDPCDGGRRRGHRGGHVPRREHQRDRLVLGAPGDGRRARDRARAATPRGRRPRRLGHRPRRHDHGRPTRRLAQGGRGPRRPRHRLPSTWSGPAVAAVKRAYRLFQEHGLRARVLAAAYRNQLQWTELVGGDLVLSPPFGWQQKFQASGIEPTSRIDVPVDKEIIASLERITDFRRAYEPDGMTPSEFDDFGATRKTLRQFLAADEELDQLVRDVITPAP